MTELESKRLFGINEDGAVDGYCVETFFAYCKGIITDHDMQCVRVNADNGPTDIETRIFFETLIADGWTPPVVCCNKTNPEIE